MKTIMKNNKFGFGLIVGIILMLLLSFKPSESNQSEGEYHLFSFNGYVYVYDSKSGKYTTVKSKDMNQGNNLKDLLEK